MGKEKEGPEKVRAQHFHQSLGLDRLKRELSLARISTLYKMRPVRIYKTLQAVS